MSATSRYGLRANQVKTEQQQNANAGKAEQEAEACIAVGLKSKEMTKQERQLFATRMHDYMKTRNRIVLKWFQDCTMPVSLLELIDGLDDKQLSITRDAYFFLQENGYINFGVLKDKPPQAETAADDADDGIVVFKLYELLRAADMTSVSEKAIREMLQEHFKASIRQKKPLIKQQVNYFIEHLDEKDTLEPLGYEGKTLEQVQQEAEQRKAQRAAAAAAAVAARAAAAAPPPKPAGRVIVVGAGPAGLAAAALLQRNNVDVLLLEARDRVGGRVHSYKGPFAAPVDLGASLITGTAPDVREGLPPDPVTFICRQLGTQLHKLGGPLPLYDGAGQPVPAELDAAVDRLRDHLLDAASEAAEQAKQQEQQQQEPTSLGAALHAAMEQRTKPTAAAAAEAPPAAVPASEDKADTTAATPPPGDEAALANGDTAKDAAEAEAAAAAAAAKEEQAPTLMEEKEEKPAVQSDEAAAAVAVQQESAAALDEPQSKAEQQAAAAAGEQSGSAAAKTDDAEADAVNAADTAAAAAAETGVETAAAVAVKAEPAGGATDGTAAAAAAITPDMLQLLDWHWANLEYGCSASLSEVSLQHWNQDEEWGGFGGPHCMVVGGFDQALRALAEQLGDSLRLSCPVSRIDYSAAAEEGDKEEDEAASKQATVKVTLADGEEVEGALVLVTVPLGVLQQGGLQFVPPLPEFKTAALGRLGFGDLNKVVMQFPEVFWDDVDYFGVAQPGGEEGRGRCFMFWNLARFNGGVPLLTSLVSGKAARAAEEATTQELQNHMLQALRRVYGDKVPEPVAVHTTRWASDEYSRGSYSFVAVGSSGRDYDILGLPVARRLLFAGEHTCKEHPDTVGGAMLSGMREAARALQLLRGGSAAEAAELVQSRTETVSKADKRKRLAEETAGEDDDDDDDEEEDESAGRAKKHKKDKHKEKKEKKQKKHKEKKEKRKHKDKAAAVSDEPQSDDDGPDKAGPTGRAGRERRAAGLAGDDVISRATAREHLRTEMTRLWRGLLEAGQGDLATVNDVMSSCGSLDGQQQCIAVLMRAAPGALQQCSQDALFLGTLNSWLSELVAERSDANLHVLRKLLELLQKVAASNYSALQGAGLLATVKKASEHRHRDVAQIAVALAKEWASKNPNKPKQQQQQQQQQRSAGTGSAPARKLAVLQQSQPQQQQPKQQQSRQLPSRQEQQQSQQQQAGAAGAEQVPLVELLAPDERQELEATQAAVRDARAQAEAAAARLAELQEQVPCTIAPGAARIASFGEYKRVSKRHTDGVDDADEPEQHAKRRKQDHHPHHHHHKHKHRPQEAAAAAGHARSSGGGSGGGGGAAAAAAAGDAADPKERAAKQLRDFVKAQLKPRFQAKELDTEDCKWVLAKVVEKVMGATSALEAGKADNFMTDKREKKVVAVIDSYTLRRKSDKQSGGGKAAAEQH